MGAIVSVVFWILRLIESTRDGSKIAAWFIRIFPSFCFSFGILNVTNKSTYALVEGYKNPKDTYDLDIAGGDIMYLCLGGVVYMILVFVIEMLEDSGQLQKFGSRELSIPYIPKQLDDDVERVISNPLFYLGSQAMPSVGPEGRGGACAGCSQGLHAVGWAA
jgi:ATP-binding cassette subfamily A (ABC1) protein 3